MHCNPIWSDSQPHTIFFLQEVSQQQVLGVKISSLSLRTWVLIGWERGHVAGGSQWREWRTIRIELPAPLRMRVCVCVRTRVCVCVWYLYQQWKCRCKEVRTLGKHLCLQDRRNALLNACSAARGCKSTHTHTRTYARTHTHASFGMNTFQFLELTLTPHCSRHLSSPPASCLSAWSRNQDYHIAQFMSIQMEQKGKSKTWVGDKVHICPVL